MTGEFETVTKQLPPMQVQTDGNNVILLADEVGQTFDVSGTTYTVTAVTTDAGGAVTAVSLESSADNTISTTDAVTSIAPATNATGADEVQFQSGINDSIYRKVLRGRNGGNGHIGALFISAGDGGSGAKGDDINQTISGSYTSRSNNLAAVIVQSIGGDGGKGGNGYLGSDGGSGGNAGVGGDVNLVSNAQVLTTGSNSYGILVSSSSGKGGAGGSGFLSGGGSGGGSPGVGGDATATNNGTVATQGAGSIGILAQSLGGSAGDGGGSWGLVSSSGGGSYGGKGGDVRVNQNGVVQTEGEGAHGVLAESIGGSGGDGGSGGGLFADGSNGGAGGPGGDATITAGSNSSTKTSGDFALPSSRSPSAAAAATAAPRWVWWRSAARAARAATRAP
ncbi:hypothetical protein [Novosphingobium sp. ST904]|uniref:hypothetical protein n=1 Tax=Novosphingobium sp. ST904 TaxID=1684385 RepID=UPI0006C84264|nr:hypothetical protein [Novosphingobium sp. ST904]KPH66209.1 hypothetical protein ADT71_07675 [Novosphingobium sp. ST904]